MNENKSNVGINFPDSAPRKIRLDQEFIVKPDGSVEVSKWLARQVHLFVPESRQLTGNAYIQKCRAWLKDHVNHKISKRRKRYAKKTGLVSVSQPLEQAFAEAGIVLRVK